MFKQIKLLKKKKFGKISKNVRLKLIQNPVDHETYTVIRVVCNTIQSQ